MRHLINLCIAASALALASPAIAQDRSYNYGTVWEFAEIDVVDGQLENYMDYLAGNWKKVQELGKREGIIVSYHVFSVNMPRANEPDLILAIEYKDYSTTAQREAFEAKVRAALGQDDRQQGAAFAGRGTMRKNLGSMELQELKLK